MSASILWQIAEWTARVTRQVKNRTYCLLNNFSSLRVAKGSNNSTPVDLKLNALSGKGSRANRLSAIWIRSCVVSVLVCSKSGMLGIAWHQYQTDFYFPS